jgi:tRNA threonylcarbamoyladenosine biosynthesis protein TsaB
VKGPGSFTGVRTGLSVGKGICEAQEIPLVGVSRLALLAGRDGLVHALLDAGRGEFYYGRYRDGMCEGERLVKREELDALLADGGRIVACEEKVLEELAGLDVEARAEPTAGDSLDLVVAGLRAGGEGVLGDANYLRRTDGEIFAKPIVGRVTA